MIKKIRAKNIQKQLILSLAMTLMCTISYFILKFRPQNEYAVIIAIVCNVAIFFTPGIKIFGIFIDLFNVILILIRKPDGKSRWHMIGGLFGVNETESKLDKFLRRFPIVGPNIIKKNEANYEKAVRETVNRYIFTMICFLILAIYIWRVKSLVTYEAVGKGNMGAIFYMIKKMYMLIQ